MGICLIIQVITGVFLAMHYCADVNMAFTSVVHITGDVNYGFILRYFHANEDTKEGDDGIRKRK